MEEEKKKFEAKYALVEEIADGGYGIVWKGANRNTKEKVAIKRISRNNYDKGDLPRLAVEIGLCKRLSHKHIVKCHDVYQLQKENEVRVVMELARGEELFSLIQTLGSIPEAVSKLLIHQLLLALQYLHSQNIVFRDIKPENLLLKEPYSKGNHHLLLCDFGLAVVKGEEKAYGAFGSVYYIAPEALEPKEYDEKVDVWATGIVAHACVTGFPPFCTDSNDNKEIIKLIQTTELDTKAKELKGCSASFISFLERTLTKDPTNRVTSTEALKLDWLADCNGAQPGKRKTSNFTNFAGYSNSK